MALVGVVPWWTPREMEPIISIRLVLIENVLNVYFLNESVRGGSVQTATHVHVGRKHNPKPAMVRNVSCRLATQTCTLIFVV